VGTLSAMSETPLRRTSLYRAHQAAGAKLVPFAGYEMPVQYAGIMAEAKAVREACGMFDVSHMARLSFEGSGVAPFLEEVTTNDVSKLAVDGGQYSLLPNDGGGCVDDIIVYKLPDGFGMVVNASNHEKDVSWLRAHLPSGAALEDHTDETTMIAVQGPWAVSILAGLSPDGEALSTAPAFGVVRTTFGGVSAQAARSGYTGEDGYELICSAADGERLWNLLLEQGVAPCGLGSRDTLRVEAGLPLYGHELNDELSPIAAGLGWVVSKSKDFIGFEAINSARVNGTPRRLVGVRLESKRLTTPGMRVLVEGQPVGEVSSGVISPTLDTGLAMAFVDSSVPHETTCTVETRGAAAMGTVVSKRFYKRKVADRP
jgi:aminomethyltransferase